MAFFLSEKYAKINSLRKGENLSMRVDLGYYIQMINQLIQDTEAVGEKMNPKFEEVKKAIEDNQLATLSSEQLSEILATFNEGTQTYKAYLSKLQRLKAPARVIGLHKKLVAAYQKYVQGCLDMIASLEGEVDVEAFNQAEQHQDEATDTIAFAIQRMTMLLMKR